MTAEVDVALESSAYFFLVDEGVTPNGAHGHSGDVSRPLTIELEGDKDSIHEVGRVVGVSERDGRELEGARACG